MKKRMICLALISILLVSPLVLAQEQSQTYSGFDRFIDNAKLFFSSDENKVALALEIREKEVNSAIENIQENNEKKANKNLENALEKLLIVQEKVSSNSAEEVEESVDEVVEVIEESNLTETFDRYVLEEEKTQLVAELVVEINGTEGQTLTREVVKSENENRKTVRITVQTENGIEEMEVEGNATEGNAVWEIVEGIDEVDSDIQEWAVERTYAEGTTKTQEAKWIIEETVGSDTNSGSNSVDNDVAPGPQGITGYQGEASSESGGGGGDTITNEVSEGDGGEGDYAEGTTAEGGGTGEESSSDSESESSGDSSSESSESDSGGESSSITGEVIASENSDSFLVKIFKNLFKK